MGVHVSVVGDVQNEACVISKYRQELEVNPMDPEFAEYLSRELTGPQTMVQLTYGTWKNILDDLGLDKEKYVCGELPSNTFSAAVRRASARYVGEETWRWMSILTNIADRAIELGQPVVWA